MTKTELLEELNIELELIETILLELKSLKEDVKGKEPTLRDKTAAAAFLAQFYGGIENILKRICRYQAVTLPAGDAWHIELFRRFCEPAYAPLPVLFDVTLAAAMAPYRKFRHVVHHGYGFQLDWARMVEGIEQLEDVFLRFKAKLKEYIQKLGPE